MIAIKVEKDVPVIMRDGLKLASNVFRPDKPGKFPVIIAFTAFSKDSPWSSNRNGWGIAYEPYSPTVTGSTAFEAEDPLFWVNHEYILVIVDPRGFYRSPGQKRAAEEDGAMGEQGILHYGYWARDMYDAIEWAGTREWSNGNVGMSGVSILAFSQWRAAALKPPHLKAFIAWEAMTDYHRDIMFRGGIPETEWGKMIGRHGLPLNPAWPPPEKEDLSAAVVKEEDDFLAEITAPALLCATWSSHGCHTRGAFRAFRKISSPQKWLYTHGRQEWGEFYTAEAQTMRKMFFDHFLKDADSRILDMPRVRLETRDSIDKYSVRHEKDFPVPGTKYTKLYLDSADNSLKLKKNDAQSKATYDSAGGKAVFSYEFEQETELTGYMSLNIWVSPEQAEDMDLFITLKKLDSSGKEVPFDAWILPGRYPVAFGWLRLSHRALNEKKSTPWEPYMEHVTGPGEKVDPGDIVLCKAPILPSSTLFHQGETLKLVVSGTFGGGEIGNAPYGFNASVNRGTHSIYVGGKYDSYLLVPVIPPK